MKKFIVLALGMFLTTTAAFATNDEIEVEIYENYAEVEYEIEGDEGEFDVDLTNEDDIIEAIAEELDISESDVEDIIEFEYDDEDDMDDEDSDDDECEENTLDENNECDSNDSNFENDQDVATQVKSLQQKLLTLLQKLIAMLTAQSS